MAINKEDIISRSIPDEEIADFERSLGIISDNITEKKEENVEEPVKKTTKKKTTNKKNTKVKEEIIESEVEENNEEESEVKFEKLENKKLGETKIESFLKNISVDLNNIELVDTDEITQFNDIQNIFENKSVYQVVLNQSCYVAFMEPLNMSDINSITNSTLDNYQSKLKLYQVVFNRINNTSLGKIDFNTFLNITSFFDLSTLLYGIYMQTFPGSTDFDVRCKHCKKTISVSINNDSLISIKNDEVYENMQKIFRTITTPEEALKNSLVNKYERVMLPDSKIIMEIQTPSLNDNLVLLSSMDFSKIQDSQDLASTLMFIKKIYVLNIKETSRTGRAKYFEVTKKSEIFNILKNLSVQDMKTLATQLGNRLEKYSIDYKIKGFECTNCHKDVGNIPVDIENLLFRQILQL